MLEDADQGNRDGFIIDCYAQRMEYFVSQKRQMAALLRPAAKGHPTSPSEIVINVRAAEILRGKHPDMMPLPVSYYQRLVKDTGLSPVFVGQVQNDVYGAAIRAAFPDARFVKSSHWIEDFQTVRNATNIAVAVSTFSWLAAWLSTSATTIHLPVAGIFNPQQRGDIDLLPKNDDRYIFHNFPVERYKATPEQLERICRI
ncbi:MAG: hypothetical protein M3Y78_05070 [Pseudomonadota bacterium]|nr:hypothetical protein [Pseudomonadota bacterium]